MNLDLRDDSFRRNPYAIWAEARKQTPVCRVEPLGFWAVTRYDDVAYVLKNPKIFSSQGVNERFKAIPGAEFLTRPLSMVGSDAPDHTRLRGLVMKAFTPAAINQLGTRIRVITKKLIADILNKPLSFDLIEDLAIPLPVTLISEMLGVDADRKSDFKRWSDTMVSWRNTQFIEDSQYRNQRETEIVKDCAQMLAYFEEVIEQRRLHPQDDLISRLILASDNEQRLSAQEVVSLIRLLLVAGNETTTNLIGNTVLALLKFPHAWDLAQKNPKLIPNMIEESLRFDSPVLSLLRRVSEDTILSGFPLKAGSIVMPTVAAANHDPDKFPNPEIFDIERNTLGQLAFGLGIHFCLGAPLARLEAKIAFEEIFEAFQTFARVDDSALHWIDSFSLRGLTSLPLYFQPRRTTHLPEPTEARNLGATL